MEPTINEKEFKIVSPPTDGITEVKFASHSKNLLVSSWDGKVRLYDCGLNCVRREIDNESPILSCCYGFNDETVYWGDLNGLVKKCARGGYGEDSVVGMHAGCVKEVCCANDKKLLVTGGWDKKLKVWGENGCVSDVDLPEKVFAMDVRGNTIVVGMNQRYVHIYDMRSMSVPVQQRESSFKTHTRNIRISPDGKSFVVTSTEGRVSVDYFDLDPASQANKYAFKCHLDKVDGIDRVYPINALAFHPVYGTFATGGCDGMVYIWDGVNRRRLCQFHKYETSIASLDFNSDGSLLAVASSYTFEHGVRDHPNDNIYIRRIGVEHVSPKPKTK